MTRRALALLACAAAIRAETAVERLLEDKFLLARVKVISESVHGVLGVAAIDLTSGHAFVFNGDAEFPSASTIKIPIMVELFRRAAAGTLMNLSEKVTLEPRDMVGGDGILKDRLHNGPVTLTARELIEVMIEHSDNTATNRCIAIAGMENVNRLITRAGLRATHLRRVMMDSAAAARGEENTTSPLDMARFVESLYRGQLAGVEATSEMMSILRHVNADVRKAVPADIPVAP